MYNSTTAKLNTQEVFSLTSANTALNCNNSHNFWVRDPSRYTLPSTPQNTMTQTKVAVFKVERDTEKKTIINSTFMEEIWVERVAGVSLELLAAKNIKDFDPLTMVIKEVSFVNL